MRLENVEGRDSTELVRSSVLVGRHSECALQHGFVVREKRAAVLGVSSVQCHVG